MRNARPNLADLVGSEVRGMRRVYALRMPGLLLSLVRSVTGLFGRR